MRHSGKRSGLWHHWNCLWTAGRHFVHFRMVDAFWECMFPRIEKQWLTRYNHCSSTYLQKGKTTRYDTKRSDGEAYVMLELWGIRSTSSLQSLPDLIWPGVVAPNWVLCMGQVELNVVRMLNWIASSRTLFNFQLCIDVKLNCMK